MSRLARPNLRAETTASRLAGLTLPQGGAWLRAARGGALARVEALGLPQRRDEYWRFTDPTTLTAPDPTPAAPMNDDEGPAFAEVGALRLVFVDGRFDPQASDADAVEGLEIERLSDAATRDLHWAQGLYGTLEAEGQKPVARPLAALNTAFAGDGVLIRVTGVVERPVHIVYRHDSTTSDAILHHVVKLEPGARLTLLESGPAAARFNKVTEVEVADGATFHHVRTQGRDRERRAATHIFARLGERSDFRSFTLTFNGVLTRNEVVLNLTGDDAIAHVAGAAVGDGDFHHDDTVFVTHGAESCESRQVFKKVLRNGATGVFQGKILVKPGAQKTDGYQLSQALLLDERSQFLAKPELEIYADDVKCSHGSTAGALDETAMFYLRSRGVPERDAKDLLTLAFLQEALQEIADERLAQDLSRRLEGWLSRRR
ncbi:Iron-sulfur cluster assembly protein SufD [Rubellimicrobium mesophilum DSM 19309]|uniref:Iron-sulfur cluster assembly protein SufD n=1 Tax=Rubellimicrobium mesophilum DSM 19309 TaxID=442562 RepID=A0A017HQQ6_9RHOB|nr:Fe-S cluster assembly protein SufD [Rubellimicrobium mesophilum]EYD76645.1 Iron-sulfur cluster assembly protein SufD [Rubellimicrobium mesophilum DSM 19309]